MATPIPFEFKGTLFFPPDDGTPSADRPFGLQGTFKSLAEWRFDLVGSASQVVTFGTVPAAGAKVILIEVDPDPSLSAAPVIVVIDGGDIEISQGGFLCLASPKPVAGIVGLTLTHTTTATVRLRVLG